MVEIEDIKDRESLEAWLKTQPQKTSVAIAQRAAMRVLPHYWLWELELAPSRKDKLTALPILWMILISGVAADCLTPEISAKIKHAAFSATKADEVATDADIDAADAADAAYYAAASTTDVYSDSDAAKAADAADMWNIIRIDCLEVSEQGALAGVKLWREHPNPLADKWQQIKQRLANDDVDWSFWIKWVEASLNGELLNWDMLNDIALIDPEDWEQGPAHINPMIAEIEAEYEGEALTVSHVQILSQNASVIEAQLDTLVQLVTEEIIRIRGANDVTKAEGEQIAARVLVLESIIEAVNKIRTALAGEDKSTALTVIDEQLPQVIEGAVRLEQLKPEDVLSPTVIAMGVAVKYLTGCGMDSSEATKVAAGDILAKKAGGWFRRNPKQ